MEKNSNEIENLILQSKKHREVCKVKQNLEKTLAELTICNNVAIHSKSPKTFNEKVLKVSCKLVGTSVPPLECIQTLVISVQNVSEQLVFNCDHWQFCVSMNHDRTQSTWNLDVSLRPGQSDTFCCPWNKTFTVEKVSVSLKFLIHFESKIYTRFFPIQECLIDVLHCLDPGRIISETVALPPLEKEKSYVDMCVDDESKVSFTPITQVLLRVDTALKEKFIKGILLRDSFHRGFSDRGDELSKPEISVYYLGNKVDISLKTDYIAIKCENPAVLCAVKAAILRRLVTVEGLVVEGLDDKNLEKVNSISLKLIDFESSCNPNSVDVKDLMGFYLDLRDVSESIRFSVAHVVE